MDSLHIFAGDPKVELRTASIQHLRSAEHLHKLFIVRDTNQLEILLGRSSVKNATNTSQFHLSMNDAISRTR